MNASPTASKPSALTAADLKVDHVYSAERPRTIGGFDRLIDDRQIVWISDDSLRVQYDSPTVPFGTPSSTPSGSCAGPAPT